MFRTISLQTGFLPCFSQSTLRYLYFMLNNRSSNKEIISSVLFKQMEVRLVGDFFPISDFLFGIEKKRISMSPRISNIFM